MKCLIASCLLSIVWIASTDGCVTSKDCSNNEDGRWLCWNSECHRDVPCNKDNDCFFWAAADVAENFPHPKCYDVPSIKRPPNYGTCVLQEHAGDKYVRIPGEDVAAVEESQASA